MDTSIPMACDLDLRVDRVRARGRNGIDYMDAEHDPRVLNLYLFREAPDRIRIDNIRISGGVRVRDIRVLELQIGRPGGAIGDARLQIVLDQPGDLSTYRLSLVETDALGVSTGQPMAEFDPFYASIDFTFREGRTTEVDCATEPGPSVAVRDEPDINYLAKDYASFRQLILDRMAFTMPQWTETHVPDIGIALVEILAYVGDYLSYYQDAVATEAYLNTARKRISVRRHLRLLGYRMHDGCNSRTWIRLTPDLASDHVTIDPDAIFFISADDLVADADIAKLSQGNVPNNAAQSLDVFEPVLSQPLQLFAAHSSIPFYCWGDAQCRLPAHARRATLRDGWDESKPPKRLLNLKVGDFLCFEQLLGIATGLALDADPTQRHMVRLTSVQAGTDELFEPAVPIVEIEWAWEDALPFALQLSAVGPAPECAPLEGIFVARGNVFLADEGLRILNENLGRVLCKNSAARCASLDVMSSPPVLAAPYQPTLRQAGLISTQVPGSNAPAAGLLKQDPALALPWIRLQSIPGTPDGAGSLFNFSDLQNSDRLINNLLTPPDPATWYLRARLSAETRRQLGSYRAKDPLPAELRAQMLADLHGLVRHWACKVDLLNSGSVDAHFVVELDDTGLASLRFGDGVMGRAPEAGEAFMASYRIGLGPLGHAGAESIRRASFRPGTQLPVAVTPLNPFAAEGAVLPQSIAEARAIGPGATSILARAVTADDYATLAERNPRVQRAAAVLLWTGNRHEARVAIDPVGSEVTDESLLRAIRADLEQARSIGHDLSVVPATYVPIDLAIVVQLMAGRSRAHVERALREALGNTVLADGSKGFFHPDNLSFGTSVDAGRLMAVAQSVAGVQSVQVKTLRRLFEDPGQQAVNGILAVGPLEVARLDNRPSLPENGRIKIEMRGGR